MAHSKTKLEQLELRRAEVVRLKVRGFSNRKIASFMNISPSTINRDEKYIDSQYLKESEDYTKRLPIELRRLRQGVNEVLQMAWSIADNSNLDAKTRLQAGGLINDTYRLYGELIDGSVDVERLHAMLSKTEQKVEDITTAKNSSIKAQEVF